MVVNNDANIKLFHDFGLKIIRERSKPAAKVNKRWLHNKSNEILQCVEYRVVLTVLNNDMVSLKTSYVLPIRCLGTSSHFPR